MKVLDKTRDILDNFVSTLISALFLILFLVGIYAIFDARQVEIGAEVDEEVAELAPKESSDSEHSITELQKINPEIVAWLTIDNTHIDYPVLQTQDNTKYLTKDYRGNNSAAGGIFADYRNTLFDDDYMIIYGHRMNGDLMFSDVTKFTNEDYFNSHEKGTLYTINGAYELDIILSAKIEIANTDIYNLVMVKNEHNAEIIDELKTSAIYMREVEIADGDKLLLLSTCDRDSKHYRTVILARMRS